MKNIIKLILLFGVSNLFGFEVNTHQAITRCAVIADTSKCETEGAKNLHLFAEHTELTNTKYPNQKFEKYGNKTYQQYAEGGKGLEDWQIKIGNKYIDLLEAGVVLEDAVYHNEDKRAKGGDGRFNNHFYSAQFDARAWCRVMGFPNLGGSDTLPFADADNMQTSKTLCMGWGERTDNITWALKNGVNLGRGRVNDYGIHDAFSYFRKSFAGSAINRKKYQAKLFVSLGFMIHMIQDLHSPAHVRDGSHSLGDYLEVYGRYDGGFNLRNGVMNPKNNHDIERAIKNFDIAKVMLRDNKYTSYQDFFQKEADWVSNNFFSEAHNAGADSYDKETGEGLSINNFFDRDTIFDNYNDHLSKGEISYTPSSADTTGRWQYIKTDGNVISTSVKGVINPLHKVVALVEKGLFFDSEHMLAPKYGIDYNQLHKGLVKQGFDKTPLADTAINVMPRAVASSQAFINFFFRGQMDASLSTDHTKLVIQNVSVKEGRVHHKNLLTFKTGGKFTLYVEKSGIAHFVGRYTLNTDIKVNETYNINIGNIIKTKGISTGAKITVVYDGDIGDNMGGYNSYAIGMRGLSADVFTVEKSETECTNIEKLVMEDITWMRKHINKNRHFSMPDLNTKSNDQKRIYIYKNTNKKAPNNWTVKTRVAYSNRDYRRYVSSAIDYFNKNIYHLITDPPPVLSNHTIKVSSVKIATNLSFNIEHYSDGYLVGKSRLHNLMKAVWYDGLAHFNSKNMHHYDIWCTGNAFVCNNLKATVPSDSNQAYQSWNIDFIIWENNFPSFVNRVKVRLESFYLNIAKNPPKLQHYPKDWGARFVSWVRSVDLEDCKTLKNGSTYDKLRIEKVQREKEKQ